jgi:hypothetical protein
MATKNRLFMPVTSFVPAFSHLRAGQTATILTQKLSDDLTCG